MDFDLRVARIAEDLVILDLARDAYLCLPRAHDQVQLGAKGQVVELAAPLRLALAQAGFSAGPARWAVDLGDWTRPSRDLSQVIEDDAGLTPGGIGRPLSGTAMRSAEPVWAGLRATAESALTFPLQPLRSLVRQAARWRGLSRPLSNLSLEDSVVAFERWSAWSPVQGRCLYRAFVRFRFLNLLGHDADWVFGVRTWPFQAHCWLQVGDLVIGDRASRVAAFTPILVA